VNDRMVLDLGLGDLVDVLVVAALVWLALRYLRRTRAGPALLGLAMLGGVYLVANWFSLELTAALFQAFFAVLVLVMVVVFQDDLRRFFEQIGALGSRRRNREQRAPDSLDVVARAVAPEFLPRMAAEFAKKGVEMRVCAESMPLLATVPGAKLVPATEQDWSEEYLAPIISIKIVAGVDEAIAHINRYSSHHTDAILTRDHVHAQQFLREVDSASVMVNASTRFADGFEYGLGAEIGISTDKFHARGPVGIEGLTSLKWVVLGQGEVRG